MRTAVAKAELQFRRDVSQRDSKWWLITLTCGHTTEKLATKKGGTKVDRTEQPPEHMDCGECARDAVLF